MPSSRPAENRSDAELIRVNRGFYESLWAEATLIEPERFNTWPLVHQLASTASRRLEVAPGLRPRLPLQGTCFVDLSHAALQRLHQRGADAVHGMIGALPCANASFDLICALDILEHVADDDSALAELARVAMPGATVLLSVPLHPEAWTAFDDFVGHCRRYEPAQIVARLAQHGFTIEHSAVYGMQPKSSRLLDLGQWYLTHRRERAMWWYNRVFMPLGLRFQKALQWRAGLGDTQGVDELLLHCRYRQVTD
ncbi:methyltransferase domain-containing protein [Rhodanobacter sp. C03]|uniref:class I SAM-dependent methyltransferase n=1 Tax=Rhodanobacter sp. C03 TaxID=1945858 RepID=UPI000984AAA2|nr:methyltransferase domain-containing protein [Rhodanobacter sp. C03]OOG59794.1 SAM-dependent methyltransferase [Rhodanobacter sp. C03]